MTEQTAAKTKEATSGLTIEATPPKSETLFSPDPTVETGNQVEREANQIEQDTGQEHPETVGRPAADKYPLDINFFPMFIASFQAALITLVGNIVLTVFIALQFNAGVQIRQYARVFPYVALETDLGTFRTIVLWSTLLTAALLIIFSVSAFVTQSSLRVQAGRSFAWIDAALLGVMQLYRQYFLDGLAVVEYWMWGLVLVGVVGFAVCSYIIWLDVKVKEAELMAMVQDQSAEPASAASASASA